jgi:uncharacterized protein YndB with AHSA1/START domain
MTEVERTERYPVAVAELWEALTDPELLAEWFAPAAHEGTIDIDLRPGGTMRFGEGDGEAVRTAVVEEVDPGRRLAFTWSDRDEVPGSRVEIDLIELDDGESELRVREALVDETDAIILEPPVERFPIGFQPPRALARA